MRIALVLVALATFAGAFFYGVHVGKQSAENKVLVKEVTAVQSRQRTNHEVKNLNHDAIINELDDFGWLRND